MKGDASDFAARLRLTLPEGWAAGDAPLLHALLNGLGAAWASMYELLQRVRLQSRVATVTGRFLDMACGDFFGGRFRRRAGEDDDALRGRLQRAMRRERGTRAAVIAAAEEAGFSVVVFEPARPSDTGAYSVPAGLAWNVAGGWGSLAMPLQCLVVAEEVAAVEELGPAVAEALPAGGVAWVRFGR